MHIHYPHTQFAFGMKGSICDGACAYYIHLLSAQLEFYGYMHMLIACLVESFYCVCSRLQLNGKIDSLKFSLPMRKDSRCCLLAVEFKFFFDDTSCRSLITVVCVAVYRFVLSVGFVLDTHVSI